MKLLSAEWTFCSGVTPLGDAFPAEQVTTGRGCCVSPFLQAQNAAGVVPSSFFRGQIFLVSQAAVQLPVLPCSLLLFEAVQLKPKCQKKVEEGDYSKELVT